MAKIRAAINGFGRVGRTVFKIAIERGDIEIVAINDSASTEALAHLLKHDTNYGGYARNVAHDGSSITVDGTQIPVTHTENIHDISWHDQNVDVVIESTGRYTDPAAAQAHCQAGAKRVVVGAVPTGQGADMVVLGVNDHTTAENSPVISAGSCTTACVAPVLAILDEAFGVENAMLTSIHSYTASQSLQDAAEDDLRLSRAGAQNIVPGLTHAVTAVAALLPNLADSFDGLAVRVPTPVVSLADITVVLAREVTADAINQAFTDAAKKPFYQGIVGVTSEPLVSSDFKGDSRSAIIDLSLTKVAGGTLAKVLAWYDNEWGYANRLVELAADVGRAARNS